MKKIGTIMAEGVLQLAPGSPKGKTKARIAIGRPRPDPEGDWLCPIQIEHFTDGVTYAHGVGSLDALLNAIRLLEQFFFMNTVTALRPKRTRQPTTRRTVRRVPRRP